MEIEYLGKRSGVVDANINKMQEREERISGVEDAVENTDWKVKENVNAKIS